MQLIYFGDRFQSTQIEFSEFTEIVFFLGSLTESAAKRPRRSSSTEVSRGIAFAYIGRIAAKLGKLDIKKCISLGVPPGPLLAKLKDGFDIQLNNGNLVRSSDVCDPTCPGPVFVVVECPSEAHLDSLVGNDIFKNHQQCATDDDSRAELVIHFTPRDVLMNKKYQNWMNDFSASTNHWIINDSNQNPPSIAIYRIQAQLNLIDDAVFPLLPAQKMDKLSSSKDDQADDGPFKILVPGRPLQKYFLRPPKKLLGDQEFNLDNDLYCSEALENDGLKVSKIFCFKLLQKQEWHYHDGKQIAFFSK